MIRPINIMIALGFIFVVFAAPTLCGRNSFYSDDDLVSPACWLMVGRLEHVQQSLTLEDQRLLLLAIQVHSFDDLSYPEQMRRRIRAIYRKCAETGVIDTPLGKVKDEDFSPHPFPRQDSP